jgi:hypothetical protein
MNLGQWQYNAGLRKRKWRAVYMHVDTMCVYDMEAQKCDLLCSAHHADIHAGAYRIASYK